MKQELWVLEWSKHSNNFHIQELSDSLAWAQMCFVENKPNLWSILMVGTHDAVSAMADTHRHRLQERGVKHA